MLNECVVNLCPNDKPFRNSSTDTCKSNIEMDTICRNTTEQKKNYYVNLDNDKIDLNSQCMKYDDRQIKTCLGNQICIDRIKNRIKRAEAAT